MDKKTIIHITNKHYRKTNKHFKHIFPDFDADSIHQFRVEFKKLRAFLRIISVIVKNTGALKVSKELKKGYARAGYIRNLQLQYKRIIEATKKEPKAPLQYLHLLKREVERQKPELKEIYSLELVKESRKKIDAAILSRLTATDARHFIQKKWNSIYAIIASRQFSDENIHTIRKNLKDLHYDKEILQEMGANIFLYSIWKDKNEKDIENLVDELGNFQDKYAAIALIKAHWLVDLNNYNRLLLTRIKKSLIREKVSTKKLLLKKLLSGIIRQP